MTEALLRKDIDEAVELWKLHKEIAIPSAKDAACDEESSVHAVTENARVLAHGRACIVRLADGDIHVCDDHCSFGSLDPSTGCRVCVHTGRVVGCDAEDRYDDCTGRSIYSTDPDAISCPARGAWRQRRDMLKASSQAWIASSEFDDTSLPVCAISTALQKGLKTYATTPPKKRSPPCVDEVHADRSTLTYVVDTSVKRRRQWAAESPASVVLMSEARMLLDRVAGNDRSAGAVRNSATCASAITASGTPYRPRDVSRLYSAALNKYLREVHADSRRPCFDEAHNISLLISHIANGDRTASGRAVEDASTQRSTLCEEFKNGATRLAVALWHGVSATPYMNSARRGEDGFRSFCVGVFFAFKRGVTLPDGTVIVPRSSQLAAAIASPPRTVTHEKTRALQAYSHRGLCTLHRCIASLPVDLAQTTFVDAIAIAKSDALLERSL